MELNDVLLTILYAIVVAVTPILSTYLVSFLRSMKDKNNTETENKILQAVCDETLDIITRVVDKTSQTFVDNLKQAGKFDTEAQKVALNKAVTEVKSMLNDEYKTILVDTYNDLDTYIETIIESYIKASK